MREEQLPSLALYALTLTFEDETDLEFISRFRSGKNSPSAESSHENRTADKSLYV